MSLVLTNLLLTGLLYAVLIGTGLAILDMYRNELLSVPHDADETDSV